MSRIHIVHNPKSLDEGTQARKPLTHHEILKLIGPFTRRGRHADMTATERAERRLVFKPIERPSPLPEARSLREDLELEVSERNTYRLTRTLTARAGSDARGCLSATLTAAGPDCGALLDQIERFPPARHFPVHQGIPLQRCYRLAAGARRTEEAAEAWTVVLTRTRAEVRGVTLEVDADRGGDMPAQLRLGAPSGQRLQIPPDLIAVLGRHIRPLEDYTDEWRGTIKAREKLPARTPEMEDKLERIVVHLAETLSQSPRSFHHRHRGARWRVTLQRATPLLLTLGLIAATPAVSLLPMGEGTLLRMLIFHAPPLMLASLFLFNEIPRIEIPPLPRPLRQERWLANKS